MSQFSTDVHISRNEPKDGFPRNAVRQELVNRELEYRIAVATNNHPNLVELMEVPESMDFHCKKIPNSKGLLQYLYENRYRLTLPDLFELYNGMFEGLARLHLFQIVHRDFSPANCLVALDQSRNFKSILKITDYETAVKIGQEITRNVGTEGYAAPEIRYSRQKYLIGDVKMDIYSLGKTLSVAFCFKGLSLQRVDDAVLLDEISKSYSQQLAMVLEKALAYEPERRFSDVRVFQSYFNDAFADLLE